jgi:phosphohistidine phosphatase
MSCILYLVRHGIAEARSASGDDADRRLTEEGANKMRQAAIGLKRLGVEPEAIVSSPLRRAQETANILADTLARKVTVDICPLLAPGTPPSEVVQGLSAYRRAAHVMLVGHQPDLGELASHLLSGSPAIVPLAFKKGAVAAIEVTSLPPAGEGTLVWFVTSKQLRLVAGER